MNIRLDTNSIPAQTQFQPASVRATEVPARDQANTVTVTKREFPDFTGAEEVDAVTEADVATRDDALGKLFHSVFAYAPPPMPNFA